MDIIRRSGHDWPKLHLLGLSGPRVMLWHSLEINKEVKQPLISVALYQS